ncbi:MAG: hypothetical protein KAJ49_03185, partial [Arcobacteraceae bacterium]|nr:hypothetical protein [Arcobacteraceae bacterium]
MDKNTSEAEKVKNYPINNTASKMADFFFVYDYVTKMLEVDDDAILINQEYKENKNHVKNDKTLTTIEKAVQLDSLKDEYNEDEIIKTKVKDIFKELHKNCKNIT